MIQFDEHIFEMGWNHQLDLFFSLLTWKIELHNTGNLTV